MGEKTFVGFGFGAIQAGLFLYEAQQSGNFSNIVVVYRRPDVIDAIRKNKGCFYVNIAYDDCVAVSNIGPIEIQDVNIEVDRQRIIEAVANASEISTALGSIADYVTSSEGSVHQLIAKGLLLKLEQCADVPAVIYTAENDMKAAECLQEQVLSLIPQEKHTLLLERVQFLNSVIGKMCGTVIDTESIQEKDLETIAPNLNKAFLVESFNTILVSNIMLSGFEQGSFRRGILSFEEKDDLLPFEEAKLYGHNAVHALAAYLAKQLELTYLRELQLFPEVMDVLHDAALLESGAVLIKRHRGKDALFTKEGFKAFMDRLITRMLNPFLNDSVERIGRDIPRKLGWDDRLVGTIRLARAHNIHPQRLSIGVAAALSALGEVENYQVYLKTLWQKDNTETDAVLGLIDEGFDNLKQFSLDNLEVDL